MACKEKLYINKAFDIPLPINANAGFTDADVASMTVTLTLIDNPATTVTFTTGAGEITFTASDKLLHINQGKVTVEGNYKIKVEYTDTGGEPRRPTPCNQQDNSDILRFYS